MPRQGYGMYPPPQPPGQNNYGGPGMYPAFGPCMPNSQPMNQDSNQDFGMGNQQENPSMQNNNNLGYQNNFRGRGKRKNIKLNLDFKVV